MTKTVYKWTLTPGVCEIEMPDGADILTVQAQHAEPVLWALVNPDAPVARRTFRVIGTGHDIGPGEHTYIGTLQLQAGALVIHVFEQRTTSA